MNLTAVRDPELFARLHLTECLLAGQLVPAEVATVMDFGSGAGLPGIPMAIARPELAIALAESQGKKAAFLREAVRELRLDRMTVFRGRVEDMEAGLQFDMVALRAVDNMPDALQAALARVCSGGWCMVVTSEGERGGIENLLPGVHWSEPVRVPGTSQRVILQGKRVQGI